ncbi:MAG: hypothetical protein JXA57_05895 [Armatimonadetes bacterium]|nr:hypothetical protein [Armatimonadota bacterium]
MAARTPSATLVLYSPDELLSRPIEHVLEAFTCRELAAVIGCNRMVASLICRGERDLEPVEAERLRDWLAQGG